MAGSKVNAYAIGDVNLTSLMETVDRQRRGYQALSLTNFASLLEPKIASGSLVEVSGALFKFEIDESITGWSGIANSNEVYIKLVPSGSSITAVFTTTAPVWSDSKQGFYSTNDRYIGGLYKDGSGNYSKKWLYKYLTEVTGVVRVFGTGDLSIAGMVNTDRVLEFASDASIGWDESANEFVIDKALRVTGKVKPESTYHGTYQSASPTENAVFDALAPFIPNVGDTILISGSAGTGVSVDILINFNRAFRSSSTVILLYGCEISIGTIATGQGVMSCTNGIGTAPMDFIDYTPMAYFAISW